MDGMENWRGSQGGCPIRPIALRESDGSDSWAAILRINNFASIRLLDIPHPVCEGELYGRYLVFEKQPSATFISLSNPDYESLKKLVDLSREAAFAFSLLYRAAGGNPECEECDYELTEEWVARVQKRLRWTQCDQCDFFNSRSSPNWNHYRRLDKGFTLMEFDLSIFPILGDGVPEINVDLVKFDDQYLVKTGGLCNLITKKAANLIGKILGGQRKNRKWEMKSLRLGETGWLLPTESHLICFFNNEIIAIETDGSRSAFEKVADQLRGRHQEEARILHSTISFCWSNTIDDDRFEQLVYELLNRDLAVIWVRKVGASRASDGGRDLLVLWNQPPAVWETTTEAEPLKRRRVIVQCKALSRSVNLKDVGDVVGIADLHDANGYLLVAFPRVTPQLLDYLATVPVKRQIWADWWTQLEIETRLRSNIDIAYRFPDLVKVEDALGS